MSKYLRILLRNSQKSLRMEKVNQIVLVVKEKFRVNLINKTMKVKILFKLELSQMDKKSNKLSNNLILKS